uniref:ATP synthase F0 subunit 8 n=1 Tax=Pterobdella arugamensis TaxID=3410361 RepID=A0A343B6W2_9ANNE|nr:ATP synthase F0 subunit 8 [Zeylanicobdella arugamensis]AQT26245.1 ATP synthase F0 subunit 8 [Zeylanicobdella arugamensis]
MPHLSPMLWIYMMILIWSSIYLLNTQTWWNSTKKVYITNNTNKSKKSNTWNW